ncbi:MAG: alpha/beta hydrolase, partial [Actinobacteria bacterium]|nr:alpha/beta hydrolase [Actinomycetota bacterium]
MDEFKKAKVGDIEIAYREYGYGFPLVKIVGFASTMDGGDPELVAALADRFRVITFDNRGMGETSAGTQAFTIEQFAKETAGLMDALGIEHAHVLGISMGGFIAQELALRYPEKVEKLILMASSCGGIDEIPISPEVMEKLGDFSGTTEERLVRMATLLFPQSWLSEHEAEARKKLTLATRPPPIESVRKQAAAMQNWPGACDGLDGLKIPTLVIAGTEDQVI